MAESNEVKALKGKLTVLSGVLRLGHEAFRRRGATALGWHIVNNSRLVVRFDRSALVDMRGGRPRMVAAMGQAESNGNTEYALSLLRLCTFLGSRLSERTLVDETVLGGYEAPESVLEAFRYISSSMKACMVIPLREPESDDPDRLFLWVVEFAQEMPPNVESVIQLLAESYNDALWSSINYRKRLFNGWFQRGKRFTPGRLAALFAVVFVLALFVKDVNQNIAAEFEVVPMDKEICYAPFEGVVERVLKKSGEVVAAGDALMEYATEELKFKLADAQKTYDEITAKLDLVRGHSFTDNSKLGEAKLLELNKQKEAINIEKMRWYLERSRILSGRSGVFVVEDEERWEGKAVRAGELLCEVYDPSRIIAKVLVNEKDASVLEKGMGISLYLHTRPESALEVVKVLGVSPKPVLQKNGQFCYIVKVELASRELKFGMRGVARVSGPVVSLGNYLFRNLVLWWRRF